MAAEWPMQPPGTDASGTAINDHDPLSGGPLPVHCAGNRLSPGMGMGTAKNPQAPLARPSLRRDLLTGIKRKP